MLVSIWTNERMKLKKLFTHNSIFNILVTILVTKIKLLLITMYTSYGAFACFKLYLQNINLLWELEFIAIIENS